MKKVEIIILFLVLTILVFGFVNYILGKIYNHHKKFAEDDRVMIQMQAKMHGVKNSFLCPLNKQAVIKIRNNLKKNDRWDPNLTLNKPPSTIDSDDETL